MVGNLKGEDLERNERVSLIGHSGDIGVAVVMVGALRRGSIQLYFDGLLSTNRPFDYTRHSPVLSADYKALFSSYRQATDQLNLTK